MCVCPFLNVLLLSNAYGASHFGREIAPSAINQFVKFGGAIFAARSRHISHSEFAPRVFNDEVYEKISRRRSCLALGIRVASLERRILGCGGKPQTS